MTSTPAPPDSLGQLLLDCAACRRCDLAAERQQVVVSRGNTAARLMLLGEGPGAQEDSTGLPFVGRSGQLLDQLLAAAGIDSNRDAYVCNVVKCRPPWQPQAHGGGDGGLPPLAKSSDRFGESGRDPAGGGLGPGGGAGY